MNRMFLGRAVGLAVLRRPWARRMAIAWGVRRALSRAPAPLTFLSGVGIGAGLMYLLAGRGSQPAARPVKRRAPAAPRRASATPKQKGR